MCGLAIGSRNGSLSVTDFPSLVNMMTRVMKPISISSKMTVKRFTPAFASFTGRLALVRELVHMTETQCQSLALYAIPYYSHAQRIIINNNYRLTHPVPSQQFHYNVFCCENLADTCLDIICQYSFHCQHHKKGWLSA